MTKLDTNASGDEDTKVLSKLTVRLYADETLVMETDDQIAFTAVLNRIIQKRESRE